MKIRLILIAVMLAVNSWAAPLYPTDADRWGKLRNSSVDHLTAAQHSPLIYEGTLTLDVATKDTTEWMLAGFVVDGDAEPSDVDWVTLHAPRYATLFIAGVSAGDSVMLSLVLMQQAFDINPDDPDTDIYWRNANGMDSVVFEGADDSDFFNVWQFEDYPANAETAYTWDTYWQAYPIQMLAPGYIRFIMNGFAGVVDDTVISWKLVLIY